MFRKAKEEGHFVSIERAEVDRGVLRGYVEDFSEDLLLIACVNPEIRYDGFMIVRIEDVTRFESPSCCQDFVETALHLRKLTRPKAPDIDLTSFGTVLASLRGIQPLVLVLRELDEPEIDYTGSIKSISHGELSILCIDDHAVFEESPRDLHLAEITRVGFGGSFEDALHIVADARSKSHEAFE